MANSKEVQIADAIVTALGSATVPSELSQAPGAARTYAPRTSLENLETGLEVDVLPAAKAGTHHGRDPLAWVNDYQVDVAIRQRVAATTGQVPTAAADALLQLAEEVTTYLQGAGPMASATLLAWMTEPLYDPEHLMQDQVVTIVTTYTYRLGG